VEYQILKTIVDQLSEVLAGATLSKFFQLTPGSFAIEFRRRDVGYLFVSAEPSLPRIYLMARPTRDLEKQSKSLDEFGQALRTTLTGSKLISVKQDETERVVRFTFVRQEETGEVQERIFVAQLTGRSANLLLLDSQGRITHAQRWLAGMGQQAGDQYGPPAVHRKDAVSEAPFEKGRFESLSAAADNYYQGIEASRAFDARANAVRSRLRQEMSRLKKLQQHLRSDLRTHGDAEEHKRTGDLLLANIASAQRQGNKVRLKDFYAEGLPVVEIEVDEKTTLQAEAAKYFSRYSKARRAAEQIGKRLEEVESKLATLQQQQTELESTIAGRDEDELARLSGLLHPEKKALVSPKSKQAAEKIPGTRRYLSSDGYEVLVGRGAKDNDHLTFRIARSQDLWLHAADYPGSHVIVRNPTRKELPHRTIIEAAQLAARFSQANNDSRVNVNYTQQKFVSRIKGAAPGLVRLSSFRTITVEPKESIERI